MGRTQPHGIDEPHGTAPAPIFGVRPAYCQESECSEHLHNTFEIV